MENLYGLARLLRGYASAAYEKPRSGTSATSATRPSNAVIGPDATIVLDFMLTRLAGVVANLEVRAEVMRANLERLGGAIFSEQVLLALVRAGLSCDAAYRAVQRHALAGDRLLERLQGDAEVTARVAPDRLAALFDLAHHLRYTDVLFERAMQEGEA